MRLLKIGPDNTMWNSCAGGAWPSHFGLMIAASISLAAVKGLNFGVDFACGNDPRDLPAASRA